MKKVKQASSGYISVVQDRCVLGISKTINSFYILGKGVYVFGCVGLSVCLFVCGQHYSKSYKRIGMIFCGEVAGGTMKN